MGANDILDDVLSSLDPADIAPEYISMARVVDYDGNERVIHDADELADILRDPLRTGDVRIFLDAHRIKRDVYAVLRTIYAEVNERIQRDR